MYNYLLCFSASGERAFFWPPNLPPSPHLLPSPSTESPFPPIRYDGERLLSADELPPGSTLLLVVSTYEGGTPPDAARWFCR